jgi:predicted transcriptional regulator
MPKSEPHLSRRERQIMDVIYAAGEATAADVHRRIPDAPSPISVRTLLKILEKKGHLTHFQDGRRFVYRPVRARDHAGRSSLKRVLNIFFDGSLEKAVAAHLADSAAELSPDELKRISQLIQKARQKGK